MPKPSNPQSLIPNPSPLSTNPLSTIHCPTPTATVTDLGTEFGVEVDKQGRTTSHVFRGLVRVQMLADGGKAEGTGKCLHENESARVDRRRASDDCGRSVRQSRPSFVREIPKRTIKTLDLVDVVAGGDGFSGRRDAGIDPTTGRADRYVSRRSQYVSQSATDKYHRVEGCRLSTAFSFPTAARARCKSIPPAIPLTSFPHTTNTTSGYVWAGGAPSCPSSRPARSTPSWTASTMPRPVTACLFLHANKGITFDLDGDSAGEPRLQAAAVPRHGGQHGNGLRDGRSVYADLWVLVDGQVRFRRREINGYNGAFSVAIPLTRTTFPDVGGHRRRQRNRRRLDHVRRSAP